MSVSCSMTVGSGREELPGVFPLLTGLAVLAGTKKQTTADRLHTLLAAPPYPDTCVDHRLP